MTKLYRVRLFKKGYYYYLDHSKYEVEEVGLIIASKRRKKCREYLYGVDIPIVHQQISSYFDVEEDAHNDIISLTEEEAKNEYFVINSDFWERNLLTKKDLIKFDFNQYAEMSMQVIQTNNELDKEIKKDKRGVVYGKSIRRG